MSRIDLVALKLLSNDQELPSLSLFRQLSQRDLGRIFQAT